MSTLNRRQILEYIESQKNALSRRDIAHAFNLKGDDRILLKRILKDLVNEGAVMKFADGYLKTELSEVTQIEIYRESRDGDLLAKPIKWEHKTPIPKIYVVVPKQRRGVKRVPALRTGDRAVARLRPLRDNTYEAIIIRLIEPYEVSSIVGGVEINAVGAWLHPADKRLKQSFRITDGMTDNIKHGNIVVAEIGSVSRYKVPTAKIVEVLGHRDDASVLSLISIREQNIPLDFSTQAIQEANKAKIPTLADRVDLRNIPLVTIDDEDARDFDDAVWAEPDPKVQGGWHAIVAIADVSYYVTPGSALDLAARERGNSVYFPDRVVPMLPEALSNEMCSLKQDVDRGCVAVHLWINPEGLLTSYKFVRGLMRSKYRLTYTIVDQNPKELHNITQPLYGVYRTLLAARQERGTLDLDLPETRVILGEDGHIEEVRPRVRFDSHKLIEELMILANVAAAKELGKSGRACMYRVHDSPDASRLQNLWGFLKSLGLKTPKSLTIDPHILNAILDQAASTPYADVVQDLILRSQAQAEYSPRNIGHYGLQLKEYAHFTSPIRRYADLVVHRSLMGEKLEGDLVTLGQHISMCERRAALAERDTMDRLKASFMEEHIGDEFLGRITGVNNFGLFVTIESLSVTGLLGIRKLPEDYYNLDERSHSLIGRRNGLILKLGDVIKIRVAGADFLRGNVDFEGIFDISHRKKGKQRRKF